MIIAAFTAIINTQAGTNTEKLLQANASDFSTTQVYGNKLRGQMDVWTEGTNVPAGTIGYIISKPTMIKRWTGNETKFWKAVKGPYKAGATFGQSEATLLLDRGVDTFSEKFVVTNKEGIGFYLRVHLSLQIDEGTNENEFTENIKDVVNNYNGANWYLTIQEEIRTIIRQNVGESNEDSKDEAEVDIESLFMPYYQIEKSQDILLAIGEYLSDTPFMITKVSLGGIHKDPEMLKIDVAGERQLKEKEWDELNTKKEEALEASLLKLAETKRERLLYEAETEALAAQARSEGITQQLLLQEYNQALMKTPNAKYFFIPVDSTGAPKMKMVEEMIDKEIPQAIKSVK